jgi:DNA-directed RNA polymerase subunit RPC12/RpoP
LIKVKVDIVVGGRVYEIVCVGQRLLVKPAPTASKTLAKLTRAGPVYEIVCVGQRLLVKPAPTAPKTLAQFI